MVSLSYGFTANMVVILTAPIGWLLRAHALATLWLWFMVPLGLPAVGLAHAYGIAALANLATCYVPTLKDKDIVEIDGMSKREATTSETRIWVIYKVGTMLLVPALALLGGYVAHCLMAAK